MQKRILTAIIALLIIGTNIFPAKATEALPFDNKSIESLILMHKASGAVCFELSSDTQLSVAGVSRILPLLLLSEAIDSGMYSLDTEVCVSSSAARIPGPTAFIEANEIIKAELLFKSAVMIAAGDAIYALTESAFGSMELFYEKLSERLKSLCIETEKEMSDIFSGKTNTFSARELALIGKELSGSKAFMKYSGCYMDEIVHSDGRKTELVNPNRLIREVIGCSGLLTGSSTEAGYCGVFSCTSNGAEYICVILGAKNSSERFSVAKTAIEYAYSSYKAHSLAASGTVFFKDFKIKNCLVEKADIVALSDVSVLRTTDSSELTRTVNMPTKLSAPIRAGDTVGSVDFFDASGKKVATVELGVKQDLHRAAFADYVTAIVCG